MYQNNMQMQSAEEQFYSAGFKYEMIHGLYRH